MTVVIGVDPGVVHTGIVTLEFRPAYNTILLQHGTVAGQQSAADTVDEVCSWIDRMEGWDSVDHLFVEKYIDRGNTFDTDSWMRTFESEMRRQAKHLVELIDNTGSKKVIRPRLLKLLGVLRFSQVTHHQDLEAAARILVYGMLKDPGLNTLLYNVVHDELAGKPWVMTDVT